MWPGRQRHFVSPSHIGVVPLTPWEGILVEFTAKWPGAKSLRKTRKRWSGVLVNGKIWEGEKWVPEHRKKALRVAGGEKGWGGAQTAPWTEAEAGHLCGGFPRRPLPPAWITPRVEHPQTSSRLPSLLRLGLVPKKECLRTAKPRGRTVTEAGEKQHLRVFFFFFFKFLLLLLLLLFLVFFFKTAFDETKIEKEN